MAEKIFNTRVVNKHDLEANWNKAVNFIPLKGELIVYDIDETHSYERIKIGDGVQNVNDLPFVDDALKAELEEKIAEIPQVDWNQNDESAADYVKNRTHYIEVVEEVFLEETTHDFASNNYSLTGSFPELVTGEIVRVVWDGVIYDLAVFTTNGRTLIGNTNPDYSDKPFGIVITNQKRIQVYRTTAEIHTFSISKLVENVHKIDPKYLPDGGVGYTEVVEESIAGVVYDIPITNLYMGQTQTHNLHIPLQLGQTWTVTLAETFLGGTETCEVQQADDDTLCLRYKVDPNTNNARLTFAADSIAAGTWSDVQYLTGVTLTCVSGSVSTETVHKLDEKYIPDSIARAEDLETVSVLVGDTAVSEQIDNAIAEVPIKTITLSDGMVRPWEYDSGVYVFKSETTFVKIMKKTGVGDEATEGTANMMLETSVLVEIRKFSMSSYDNWTVLFFDSIRPRAIDITYTVNTDTWTTTIHAFLPDPKSSSDEPNGKTLRVNDNYLYTLSDTVWSVNGQTGDVVQTQVDWSQTDETAVDYIKNKPEIATDDEIISMLTELDMLPVVTDSDGAILADESDNILLW